MKTYFILFASLLSTASNALALPILFPKNDPYMEIKKQALAEISEIMGPRNSIDVVQNSKKVLLWANSVGEIVQSDGAVLAANSLPSFMPVSSMNEESIRLEMETQCECSLRGEEVAGILVANPYQAAEMYFRGGWSEKTAEEIDGIAAPAVIIYHEFSHAKDYIQTPDYFFDLATISDRRWKNKAEESAVMQQNDFVTTLAFKRKMYLSRRLSYGKNKLFLVSGLFETQPASKP